jgi:integrase
MKADDQRAGQKSIEQFWALQKLSKVTKTSYMMRVNQYLKHINMDADAFVAKTKKDPETFQKEFIAYLAKWGEGARPSTIVFVRDSLKRFLETSRVQNVDWSYVNQFVPERKRYGEDRAPTADEIRRIVNAADLRMRSLVLFLCSSGARIGAIVIWTLHFESTFGLSSHMVAVISPSSSRDI